MQSLRSGTSQTDDQIYNDKNATSFHGHKWYIDDDVRNKLCQTDQNFLSENLWHTLLDVLWYFEELRATSRHSMSS